MAYIDQQDLLDELGEGKLIQLTDDEGTGEVGTARVGKSISFAEAVVESYLRGRYALPVPATPIVKGLCTDLAIHHLYKSRTTIAEGVYTVRTNAKNDAIKLLQAISSGTAALDVPTAEETNENPGTSRPNSDECK